MGDRAYHETVVLDAGLVSPELRRALETREAAGLGRVGGVHRVAPSSASTGPTRGSRSGSAPSGPQRCTDEMLAACAALADELDLTIHIHVLETRMQAVSGQRMYGETLPEHMDALGFLGPRVSFEHGIWLTDARHRARRATAA